MSCSECGGLGWLLNGYHMGNGPDDPNQPLTLDLLPCIYPDCDAPQDENQNPRAIATLGIRGQFATVVAHPKTNSVIALTDYQGPDYR